MATRRNQHCLQSWLKCPWSSLLGDPSFVCPRLGILTLMSKTTGSPIYSCIYLYLFILFICRNVALFIFAMQRCNNYLTQETLIYWCVQRALWTLPPFPHTLISLALFPATSPGLSTTRVLSEPSGPSRPWQSQISTSGLSPSCLLNTKVISAGSGEYGISCRRETRCFQMPSVQFCILLEESVVIVRGESCARMQLLLLELCLSAYLNQSEERYCYRGHDNHFKMWKLGGANCGDVAVWTDLCAAKTPHR